MAESDEQLRDRLRWTLERPRPTQRYQTSISVDPVRRLYFPDALLAYPFLGPRHARSYAAAWGGRVAPSWGPVFLAILPRPGLNPDRVRQEEPIAFRRELEQVLVLGAPIVIELTRTIRFSPGVGILERVGTFLRVAFRDDGGLPVGAPFVTGPDTPPDIFEINHPTLPSALRFAWYLVADEATIADDPLYLGPPAGVPHAFVLDGLPWRWADLRFTWGGRYSESHVIVTPADTRVRIFLELELAGEQVPGRFAITGGAMLSGHLQTSSTAALRTSESLAT